MQSSTSWSVKVVERERAVLLYLGASCGHGAPSASAGLPDLIIIVAVHCS